MNHIDVQLENRAIDDQSPKYDGLTSMKKGRFLLVYLLTGLFIGAGFWLFNQHSLAIFNFIQAWGPLAPLLFLIFYALATLMFLPTMVITLAGGALFGPLLGTLYNVLGATTGAMLAFLISRHWIGDRWRQQHNPKLEKILTGVEERGWVFVALLRTFPIIPFNLVNYGLGLTRLNFRLYALATLVFLLPPELLYTYCGYASQSLLAQPELAYQKCLALLSHPLG